MTENIDYAGLIEENIIKIQELENAQERFQYGSNLIHTIKNSWPEEYLVKFYSKVIAVESMLFFIIPNSLENYQLCLEYAKYGMLGINIIPEKFYTEELLAMDAIKKKPSIIFEFEPEQQLEAYYVFAVEKDPTLLRLIPFDKRTNSLYEMAVRRDGSNLEFVPQEYKKDLVSLAVETYGLAIKFISANDLTYEICLKAVKQDKAALEYIPEKFCTIELKLNCLDLSQKVINSKIFRYLELKNRDKTFFSPGGLCNGYTFLYNWYIELGRRLREQNIYDEKKERNPYYFSALYLISLWDETKEGLEKELPEDLPPSSDFKNLNELLEYWINYIFAAYSVEKVITTSDQQSRHVQAHLLHSEDNSFFPINIYLHEHNRGFRRNIGYSFGDKHPTALFAYLAFSRINYSISPYLISFNGTKHWLKKYNYQGEVESLSEYEIALLQNDFNCRTSSPYFYVNDNDIRPFTYSPHCVELTHAEYVNLEQSNEFLKYFSRLPEGCYTDLITKMHSTTFHPEHSHLVFYNCNFAGGETYHKDYLELSSQIQKDHTPVLLQGVVDEDIIKSINGIRFHTYTSPTRIPVVHNTPIFSIQEIPKCIEQSEEFYKNSPNHFNHLHIAVICQSLISLEQLLKDGYCDLQAIDVYGRTPLIVAITNGFVPGYLLFQRYAPTEKIVILPHHIFFMLKNNHSEMLLLILQEERIIINIEELAKAAIYFNAVNVFKYLMHSGKIKPEKWFQQAFFDNNLEILELIGPISINFQDEAGNSILHTAIYSFQLEKEYLTTQIYWKLLLNHLNEINFSLQNNQGKNALDVLCDLLIYHENHPDILDDYTELCTTLAPHLILAKEKVNQYFVCLSVLMCHDHNILFSLLSDKAAPFIDHYFEFKGLKLTLLHVAALYNPKLITVLKAMGASDNLPIKALKHTSTLHSKPLEVGKTARELINDRENPFAASPN